jgi:hypothetical protein
MAAERTAFLRRIRELDNCDGYLVIVVDPHTGEVDAYGPYDGMTATDCAERFRGDFDSADLADVQIMVTRFYRGAEDRVGVVS